MADNDIIYLEDFIEPEHLLGQIDIDEQLSKLHKHVAKGYEDNFERSDDLVDMWELYKCKLNQNQTYSGESKIFIPIVHNAVNARKTRFVNQIFPQSKRHVECITTDGTIPDSILSLAEHYIGATKLRTQVIPAVCVNGDVEGQYNLYVSWKTIERTIKRRVKLPVDPRSGQVKGQGKDEAILLETVKDGMPDVEVIHDSDISILPKTADSIDDAIESGGSASIIRRWSKATLDRMSDEGVIDKGAAEKLIEDMDAVSSKINVRNTKKKLVEGTGQKVSSGKQIEVYEIWTKLKIKEKKTNSKKGSSLNSVTSSLKRRPKRKLCQIFHRSDGTVLGCRENVYWNNRCPILSCPVVKIGGQFKGDSRVKFCDKMQYAANDAVNIAMDSAMYSLMPIVLTDPERNPRVASMIMSMAAIWEVDPKSTQIVTFPDLWEKGFGIAEQAKNVILQTLSVSPAAITQTGVKKKPSQAELANEQAVDILTTADAVTVLEEGILTPLIQWFVDLDYQFRDRALTIKKYGPMGVEANMEEVEPLQMNERFEFRWLGVEAARNASQIQQQIAGMNVLRGIPPQMYMGYELNLGPMIASFVEATFGPRLSQQTFKPMRATLSLPPEQENELLVGGFEVHPAPADDDAQHIQIHGQLLKMAGPLADPHGMVRTHIQAHMVQMQRKQQAQQPQGQPGAPGGPPGARGLPGQQGQGLSLCAALRVPRTRLVPFQLSNRT